MREEAPADGVDDGWKEATLDWDVVENYHLPFSDLEKQTGLESSD